MYKVKIVTGKNSDGLFSLLPGGKNISKCGRYQFFVDEEVKDPDFLIVRNKYIKKDVTYQVAPENTILMLSEPYSVVSFPKRYRDQFGMLYSCQEQISHRNVVYGPALLPWWVGVCKENGIAVHKQPYDKLKNSEFPRKSKLISVITSNKAFTQGHQDRIEFVAKLKKHYGDKLDVFGRGVRNFDDKWDVLAPYKYHIAIENSSSKYYWTEKLSDCFLAGAYPIYYGCTNAEDYFPAKAFARIDIHDFEGAVKVIDNILKNDEYEHRLPELKESKEKVLEDYNLFDIIAQCCDRLDANAPKKCVTLRPANTLFDMHNFYMYTIKRNLFVMKNAVKKLLGLDARIEL